MPDMSNTEYVFLFGPPGSGKGFIIGYLQKLAAGFGIVSTGDLLREVAMEETPRGLIVKNRLENRKLVDPEIVVGLVLAQIAKCDKALVFIDGFPRDEDQVRGLLNQTVCKFDLNKFSAIHVNRSLDKCIHRAMTHRNREDDSDLKLKRGFKRYEDVEIPAMELFRMELLRAKANMKILETGDVDDLFESMTDICEFVGMGYALTDPA